MAVKLAEFLLVELGKDRAAQEMMEAQKAVELAKAQLVLMPMVELPLLDLDRAQQTRPETEKRLEQDKEAALLTLELMDQ